MTNRHTTTVLVLALLLAVMTLSSCDLLPGGPTSASSNPTPTSIRLPTLTLPPTWTPTPDPAAASTETPEPVGDTPDPGAGTPEPGAETPEPPADTPSPQSSSMASYESANGVLSMHYPAGWAINEITTATGLAFSIGPDWDVINNPPDFSQPVAFAYGTVNQVSPEVALGENLADWHDMAFFEGSEVPYELVGEPISTTPGPDLALYTTDATSTQSGGEMVHWHLGTALAHQTVIHYAVGISEAGLTEYGTTAQEMFDSVEIDTAVTAALAGG